LYVTITGENASMLYIEKDTAHYLDVGCVCVGCSRKRCMVVNNGVNNGIVSRVIHEENKSIRLLLKRKDNKRAVDMKLSNS